MQSIPELTEKTISEFIDALQKLIQTKYSKIELPFVTLKFAQTLDGKIATLNGDSRWISGSSSLRFAHLLRSWHDALLVGVDTIIRDNPQLTVRLVRGKNPKKIILDSKLRTPIRSNVLKGKAALSTIIATTALCDSGGIKKYHAQGAEVWLVKKDRFNQVDLQNLLRKLGQRNIRSVLVEGGAKTIRSFLERDLADHLLIVITPKIIGRGITYGASSSFKHLLSFSPFSFFRLGNDVMLEAFRKS